MSYCCASYYIELNYRAGHSFRRIRGLKSAKTLHMKWAYASHKPMLVGGLSLGARIELDRLNQQKAMTVIYILYFVLHYGASNSNTQTFTKKQFLSFAKACLHRELWLYLYISITPHVDTLPSE